MANEALEALGPDAKAVLEQARQAYYDCWYLAEHAGDITSIGQEQTKAEKAAYEKRLLQWRADRSVSTKEAVAIMTAALGKDEAYNFFKPILLEKLGPDARIVLAREYSVCIYVKVGTCDLLDGCLNEDEGDQVDVMLELEADELDRRDSYWRLWWD